ncbi:MAG: hypothetical protein PVH88_22030, partial [Ignavibacteria bacterium]
MQTKETLLSILIQLNREKFYWVEKTIKKTIVIAAIVLTTLLTLLTCGDNGVEPEVEPGRRDYTWTVDTLNIPYTTLHRIWGSAPDDVWVVGPGGDLDKTIYHFNGSEWENDGVSRIISPLSVWGFSKSDVWLGGRDGRIWHYDGTNWEENIVFERNTDQRIGFQEMWGDSPDNLFATGYSGVGEDRIGVIAYYNGSGWEMIEFPELNYNFIRIKRGKAESSNYYLRGIGDNVAIFEYDGNENFKIIYEGFDNTESWAFIQEINDRMYFVTGNEINQYINNEFKLITQINDSNFGAQI